MKNMSPKVDEFISNASKWQEEFGELRKIILDCQLNEELKWGKPCYTFQQGNIVIMQGFKEYCALLFVKGALLRDDKGLLIKQTENTQAARQLRFTNLQEIIEAKADIKTYVHDAIEVEKTGQKVDYKETSEFNMPEEFQQKLDSLPVLKKAFNDLTPGRQRAYLLYFSSAKQSQTREARIEKYLQQILAGKGLND